MFGSQENSGVVPAYLRVWKEEWIHSAKLSNWSHPHTDTLATRHRQSILAPTQQHQTATQLAHSSPTPLQHHRSLSALRPSPARASRSVIVVHCPLPIAHCPLPVARHPPQSSFAESSPRSSSGASTTTSTTASTTANKSTRVSWLASSATAVRRRRGVCWCCVRTARLGGDPKWSVQQQPAWCLCLPPCCWTWALCWWRLSHVALRAAHSSDLEPLAHCGQIPTNSSLLPPPSIKMGKSFCITCISSAARCTFPITSPHLTTPTSPTWPDLLHSSFHPPPQSTHPLLSTYLLGLSFFPSCIATHHHRPHPSSTSLSRAPTDTSTSPGDRDRDYVRIP